MACILVFSGKCYSKHNFTWTFELTGKEIINQASYLESDINLEVASECSYFGNITSSNLLQWLSYPSCTLVHLGAFKTHQSWSLIPD